MDPRISGTMAVVPSPLAIGTQPSRSTLYHHQTTGLAMIAAPRRRSQIRTVTMRRRFAMRSLALSMTVLAGLVGTPAIAQTVNTLTPQGVPAGANPDTGARPGNEIGTGM